MSVATQTTGFTEPEVVNDDLPFEPARLTVESYHRMIESGVFADDENFELLEGLLVAKMVKNPPHIVATNATNQAIVTVLPEGWHTQQQNPVSLGDSEPEPDLSVVRGSFRDYGKRLPAGAQIGLVCEVADSSLVKDRSKARIYGRAAIPYYWIVNIKSRSVECRSEPFTTGRRAGYRNVRTYEEDELIPLILDGVEVGQFAVRDLLPDAE